MAPFLIFKRERMNPFYKIEFRFLSVYLSEKNEID